MNNKYVVISILVILSAVAISGCIGEEKETVTFNGNNFDLINGFTLNYKGTYSLGITDNKTNGTIMNVSPDYSMSVLSNSTLDFFEKSGYTTLVNEKKEIDGSEAYYWVYRHNESEGVTKMRIEFKKDDQAFNMYFYVPNKDYDNKEYNKKLNETIERIIKSQKKA